MLTNRALGVLSEFKRANKRENPPRLQDYYKPSDEMKDYNIAASAFLALLNWVGSYLSYTYFF